MHNVIANILVVLVTLTSTCVYADGFDRFSFEKEMETSRKEFEGDLSKDKDWKKPQDSFKKFNKETPKDFKSSEPPRFKSKIQNEKVGIEYEGQINPSLNLNFGSSTTIVNNGNQNSNATSQNGNSTTQTTTQQHYKWGTYFKCSLFATAIYPLAVILTIFRPKTFTSTLISPLVFTMMVALAVIDLLAYLFTNTSISVRILNDSEWNNYFYEDNQSTTKTSVTTTNLK